MSTQDQQLQAWEAQLRTALEDAQALAGSLTEAQFHWQAKPDAWSIAQCLDHLDRVGGLLLPRLRDAVATAPPAPEAVWKPRLGERVFIYVVGPSSRVKMPVPAIYVPTDPGSRGQVMEAFGTIHEGLIACVRDAAGHDLSAPQVASPVSDKMRFSLGAWLAATPPHVAYHVAQARAVRESADFPAARDESRAPKP